MTTNENNEKLTPAEIIASGYLQQQETAARGLTIEELGELKQLKQRSNSESLNARERLALGYRISQLEEKK